MPFAPYAPVDLALKERIRVAYYDENRPIADVEQVAGVGRATMYRWFHAWGWPLRRPMRSRPQGRRDAPVFGREPGPPSSPPPASGGANAPGRRPAPRESLQERLRRLVEHRISLLEHEAMSGVAVDPDANARAIELNARTLVTIERLGGDPPPCPNCGGGPDGPGRTLSELRDELRARLQKLRAEARARRGLPEEDDEDDRDSVPAGGDVGEPPDRRAPS